MFICAFNAIVIDFVVVVVVVDKRYKTYLISVYMYVKFSLGDLNPNLYPLPTKTCSYEVTITPRECSS